MPRVGCVWLPAQLVCKEKVSGLTRAGESRAVPAGERPVQFAPGMDVVGNPSQAIHWHSLSKEYQQVGSPPQCLYFAFRSPETHLDWPEGGFPLAGKLMQGSKPKTCQLIQVVNLVVNPVDFPSPKLTGPDQSSTG